MSSQVNIKLSSFTRKAGVYTKKLQPYGFVTFLVFTTLIYGFVLLRINDLGNREPSADAVNNQVQTIRLTHIDENVVKKLQSLRDNSVNVQALFDEARNNPFQ